MRQPQVLLKCARVSSRTEKKRGKKEKKRKKATNIKPDIFLPNTLPLKNGVVKALAVGRRCKCCLKSARAPMQVRVRFMHNLSF
jgi:hypothetical protein